MREMLMNVLLGRASSAGRWVGHFALATLLSIFAFGAIDRELFDYRFYRSVESGKVPAGLAILTLLFIVIFRVSSRRLRRAYENTVLRTLLASSAALALELWSPENFATAMGLAFAGFVAHRVLFRNGLRSGGEAVLASRDAAFSAAFFWLAGLFKLVHSVGCYAADATFGCGSQVAMNGGTQAEVIATGFVVVTFVLIGALLDAASRWSRCLRSIARIAEAAGAR